MCEKNTEDVSETFTKTFPKMFINFSTTKEVRFSASSTNFSSMITCKMELFWKAFPFPKGKRRLQK